ncbi:TPA: hypothetical protein DF272_03610 [Candidatus Falkowbacteria bacterium]|nr:hypothetical protein [Candidatus Falkowbacteria bacterium]
MLRGEYLPCLGCAYYKNCPWARNQKLCPGFRSAISPECLEENRREAERRLRRDPRSALSLAQWLHLGQDAA